MIRTVITNTMNMIETAVVLNDRKGASHNEASLVSAPTLSRDELSKIDAYWRACNYLAAGMIYLRANPLLREPLSVEHLKRRMLGHWGTSPGFRFLYVHLIRLIKNDDLNPVFLAGPGHALPGVLAQPYLEGAY